MRFGTWNVRSHYRSGSFTVVARELARFKLDLVVHVHEKDQKDAHFFLINLIQVNYPLHVLNK